MLVPFLCRLQNVILDVADERFTGQNRALQVEECRCPPGYRGSSCEECDAGYHREDEGLYLGTCVPCNCNGHSIDCDSRTGICLVIMFICHFCFNCRRCIS